MKNVKKIKGTPGIEPGTSRSAVECSTPELYPRRTFLAEGPIYFQSLAVWKN